MLYVLFIEDLHEHWMGSMIGIKPPEALVAKPRLVPV
jgi:hypothetical protein